MSPPVEIEVSDASRGGELRECLWRRGFPAELVEAAGGWRVEVTSPREDRSRLVADLHEAIERWLPYAEQQADSHVLITTKGH